jgi:antitoxin MazE
LDAVYPEGGSMIKKLTAIGDSQGLIIEEPILELLGIDKDTPLEVKTDGEALIIRPARESRRQRVRQATERLMAHHDETLRKLAK